MSLQRVPSWLHHALKKRSVPLSITQKNPPKCSVALLPLPADDLVLPVIVGRPPAARQQELHTMSLSPCASYFLPSYTHTLVQFMQERHKKL